MANGPATFGPTTAEWARDLRPDDGSARRRDRFFFERAVHHAEVGHQRDRFAMFIEAPVGRIRAIAGAGSKHGEARAGAERDHGMIAPLDRRLDEVVEEVDCRLELAERRIGVGVHVAGEARVDGEGRSTARRLGQLPAHDLALAQADPRKGHRPVGETDVDGVATDRDPARKSARAIIRRRIAGDQTAAREVHGTYALDLLDRAALEPRTLAERRTEVHALQRYAMREGSFPSPRANRTRRRSIASTAPEALVAPPSRSPG
jgi:hypothetical protein